MPDYRITLLDNMRADQMPSALDVRYTYDDGRPTTTWPVTMTSPNGRAVVTVSSREDLLSPGHVKSRTLVGHYATPPNTLDYPISSVQPALAAPHVETAPQPAYSTHNSERNVMSTPYSVTFTMSQDTVNKLSNGNFYLFGFKAVKSTGPGAPVVWFSTNKYGLNTTLSWSEQYQAYTMDGDIVPGGVITATNSYPIDLDQSLLVTSNTGAGTVTSAQGVPLAVQIVNQTASPFTCGISQSSPGSTTPTPMCAFPLYGNMTDTIAPIEKIVLMFAAGPVNTGTVVEETDSAGILIDLTGENNVSGVSFDINTAWNTGGQPNCALVPSNANLVPLLIQSSVSLTRQVLARRSRAATA